MMSLHIQGHAQEVISRFKLMLPGEALALISDEHFSELETLIEAAMSVMQSKAHNEFIDELDLLANQYRKCATHIDE